jgi:hypothetical protein
MSERGPTTRSLEDRIDQVAANLSDFRIEAAGKFAAIETELRIVRRLGTWLLGGVLGLVAALITGAATVGWSASAVISDVRQQALRIDQIEGRIDRVEKRLDGIHSKLDVLVRRGEPKAKGD